MSSTVLQTSALREFWERMRRSAMLYGTFATALRVGANILLLPLVLKVLAPSELAFWYVLLALGGLANLADFGFGQAIVRVYSFLWAGAEDFETEGLGTLPVKQEPNRVRIRQFHRAVKALYGRLSVLAVALLASAGTLSVIAPIQATTRPAVGWLCWALFALCVIYSLATTYWSLACQGINRVRELQIAQLASGLAYVVSSAVFLLLGLGLFALVLGTLIRALVARYICRRIYEDAMPKDSREIHDEVGSMVKRLWPNARKFAMISLGAYLTIQANVLTCSYFLGSETTAAYGLTTQIGNFIAAFSALWLGVKWPEITILRTQGRLEEMSLLFARRLAFVMSTFAVLALGLAILGNPALQLAGSRTLLLPMPMLAVYLLYLFQQQFYVQFGTLAYTENVVPFFKLSMFTGLAVISLSAALAWRLGLWGLILAPLIVTVTTSSWYVTMRGFRGQTLRVRQFTRAAFTGRL